MIVYRIVKSLNRAKGFSGIGAFKTGGRWNSKGTYMLYTSMNSSLAYLETLVHFNEPDTPPDLYIISIEILGNDTMIYQLPDDEYPEDWQAQENLENKIIGDRWMRENKYMAFKVRSAINPTEFNFLLNPLFPGFHHKGNSSFHRTIEYWIPGLTSGLLFQNNMFVGEVIVYCSKLLAGSNFKERWFWE